MSKHPMSPSSSFKAGFLQEVRDMERHWAVQDFVCSGAWDRFWRNVLVAVALDSQYRRGWRTARYLTRALE